MAPGDCNLSSTFRDETFEYVYPAMALGDQNDVLGHPKLYGCGYLQGN